MTVSSKIAAAAITVALSTVASLASAQPIHSRSAAHSAAFVYDGSWSLAIQTTRGNCAAGLRAAVRISRGQVLADDQSYQVNGRVAANGSVHVTVRSGGQSAGGSGRLSHQVGRGLWRTSSGECSGQWTAERRS